MENEISIYFSKSDNVYIAEFPDREYKKAEFENLINDSKILVQSLIEEERKRDVNFMKDAKEQLWIKNKK